MPLPANHIDLYAEFRLLTCGSHWDGGYALVDALRYFGIDAVDAAGKTEMRKLAVRGGPFTAEEKRDLLRYCERDVEATLRLFGVMRDKIDLPRALIRGRYVNVVAMMEHHGIPVDADLVGQLRENWAEIRGLLISSVDRDYGVFDRGSFRTRRWEEWLRTRGIEWPRLASGAMALDFDTFRDVARSYPEVAPMKELRATLSKLRIDSLPVGPDGRNRTLLSPFRAKTGRNQPKSSQFIFGPAKWVRGLIRPPAGKALAYCDFSNQEFGISAALSGDIGMQAAYCTGDPYLAFAKSAGAAPEDATAKSHRAARTLFKTCVLGMQYAMGAETLARRTKLSIAHARALIDTHRTTYPAYWRWTQSVQDQATLNGQLQASFGWRVRVNDDTNPRSTGNFLAQANGAEMLRVACILASEARVAICAPLHDALLIEADADDIDVHVELCRSAMRRASELVLAGFPLRIEAKITRYPDRFPTSAAAMWEKVLGILDQVAPDAAVGRNGTPSVSPGNTRLLFS
ncbi:MAG TPA: DNA polymerase [Chthoniobacterales bacterium]|nr:DNA polymerase [Chthoniobacterales bacterium]